MNLKTITKLIAGVACVAFVSSTSAITLNSPGVVGIINSTLSNANETTETAAAQLLLDMLAGTKDPVAAPHKYETSSTEYAGAPTVVLALGVKTQNSNDQDMSVGAGHDYVFGKYDGRDGGYVLFAINDLAFTVPGKSGADGIGLWLNNGGNGRGLSHILVFDVQQPPDTRSIPDGGATVALLGAGLLGLGAVRRKLS